jgi:hypothetical protein
MTEAGPNRHVLLPPRGKDTRVELHQFSMGVGMNGRRSSNDEVFCLKIYNWQTLYKLVQ